MEKSGPEFYDNPDVLERYSKHRASGLAPNENIEQPILWELIGDPAGLGVLDLGCGDARIAKKFKEHGAKSYLGLEGSKLMFNESQKNLEPGFSQVENIWLEDWGPKPNQVDLLVSSLALHYIEDLESLFQKIQQVLRPNGRIVFSVEHPVITSHNESLENSPIRQAWLVDNYFERGCRKVEWMGDVVSKYHRTIEDYFNLFSKSGFELEQLKESDPPRHLFTDMDLWKRRRRIPLFLIMSGRKRG